MRIEKGKVVLEEQVNSEEHLFVEKMILLAKIGIEVTPCVVVHKQTKTALSDKKQASNASDDVVSHTVKTRIERSVRIRFAEAHERLL
tara:strand:+ start:275 stop:538 length:264 start_codon:yes stop_codon:yes gene_type:complete